MSDLPPFPLDDLTLSALEHALGAVTTVDDDGTRRVDGADMTITQLLDFLAGYDPEQEIPDGIAYIGDQTYAWQTAFLAVVRELRRVRAS